MRGASTAPPAGFRAALPARRLAAAALRLGVIVAFLRTAQGLASRGTLEAPISLFDAASSTKGIYAATHLMPVAAALLGAAALAGLLDGGWWLPRRAVAVGLLLPLAAFVLADVRAVDAFDARTALLIAVAWSGAYLALVDALAGVCPRAGARAARCPRAVRLLVLAAVALGGLRLALLAFAQFLAGVPTQIAWTGLKVAAIIPIRVTATFHNPNVFAAACLLVMGAAAALAAAPGRGAGRVAGLVIGMGVVAAGTATLVLTFSRAAYLALALACALTIPLLPPSRRRPALLALAAVALPFVFLAVKVPGVVFRLHTIGVSSGGDVTSRLFSWLDTLRVWLAHPVFGAGPEGVQPLYAPFFPRGWFGTYGLINVPGGIDNDPLQWLAETGAVGALAALAGMLLAIRAVWRRWARLPAARRAVVAPLAAALAAVLAQSLLETTLFMLPIQALCVALVAVCTLETGLARRLAVPRGPGGARWARGAAAAAVAGSLALVIGLMHPWAGDSAYLQGWAALQHKGGLPAATSDFQRAARLEPAAARDWAALADTYVLQAYRIRRNAPATARRLAAQAKGALAHALGADPYDAATWDLAALWEALDGRAVAQACAEQRAVRDNVYDSGFVLRLAADLGVLARAQGMPAADAGRYAVASLRDTGYATRLLPLVLAVYREHRFVHGIGPLSRTLSAAQATWRAGFTAAPPREPDLPLPVAACSPALTRSGLPWPAGA